MKRKRKKKIELVILDMKEKFGISMISNDQHLNFLPLSCLEH